jgi:hypothetical protein
LRHSQGGGESFAERFSEEANAAPHNRLKSLESLFAAAIPSVHRSERTTRPGKE